jgi:hypothetical protein
MEQVDRLEQHSTKFGQPWLVTVTQLKYRVLTASGEKKKVVSKVLRKYGVHVKVIFLAQQSQGTTPLILKLKFPVQTSFPQQKLSKIIENCKTFKLTSCM